MTIFFKTFELWILMGVEPYPPTDFCFFRLCDLEYISAEFDLSLVFIFYCLVF